MDDSLAYAKVVLEVVGFWICFSVGFLSLATYILPILWQTLIWRDQNLRDKYAAGSSAAGAGWALVTGGSSGIGESICRRLADQGINVVIAALPDELLEHTHADLVSKYPHLQFRKVGVNLSTPAAFMPALVEATADIPITLLFNNAGFIKPGLFADMPLGLLSANYHTNATCTLAITHHYLGLMRERGDRGLICFTSSSGGFIPGPMSSIYSSTKAWMTNFGASLAAEVIEDGIDVTVVHPSPIASNFFRNDGNMAALKLVAKTAQSPRVIADAIFRYAGRVTVIDQGVYSVGFRLLLKMLDWNLFADIMVMAVRNNADYKMFRRASGKGMCASGCACDATASVQSSAVGPVSKSK